MNKLELNKILFCIPWVRKWYSTGVWKFNRKDSSWMPLKNISFDWQVQLKNNNSDEK